jgi:hypothetical protein
MKSLFCGLLALFTLAGCSPPPHQRPTAEVLLVLFPKGKKSPTIPWSTNVRNAVGLDMDPLLNEDGKVNGAVISFQSGKFVSVQVDAEKVSYTIHQPAEGIFRIVIDDSNAKLMQNGKTVASPFTPSEASGTVFVSRP